MAGSLNRATLIGNLGNDPKVKDIGDGKEIVTFSVATTETWVRDGLKRERTEWHYVVIFHQGICNIAKRMRKGSKVYLEGNIQTRKFQKNGQEVRVTEIVLQGSSVLILLDSKRDNGRSESDSTEDSDFENIDLDDTIPF